LPEGARTAMTFVLSQSSAEHRALLSSSLSSPAREGDTLHLVSEEGWLVPASRLLLALHSPSLSSLLTSSLASTVSVPSTAASLSSLLSLLSSSSSPPSSLSHLAGVKELAATLGLHLPELALEPSLPPALATLANPNLAFPASENLETTKKAKKLKTEKIVEEIIKPVLESPVKVDVVEKPTQIEKEEIEVEWPCTYCPKRFQQMKFLTNHHNNKHPEQTLVQKKIFQCQECPKFFTSRKPFTKHNSKHKNKEEKTRPKPKPKIENDAAIERNLQFIKQIEAEVDTLENEEQGGTLEENVEETEDSQETPLFPGPDANTETEPVFMDVSESTTTVEEEEEEDNLVIVEPEVCVNIPEETTIDENQTAEEENVPNVTEEEVWYREEWICGLCTKRFSGETFVNTHFENKHVGEAKKSKKVFACIIDDCTKAFQILHKMKSHLRIHSTEFPDTE